MELDLWKAVILGAIQGLTEFLPISSSGHLALAERWLGVQQLSLSFEIIVHFGTLVALIYYFRRQLVHLSQKYLKQIAIATVPAIGFGLLLKPYLETTETSSWALALQFLISAFFMFVADQLLRQEDRTDRFGRFWQKVTGGLLAAASRSKLRYDLPAPNSIQSLLVGLFQALAILPAISRSGATLFAGLLVGLPRTEAFEFAFIISMPAVGGAIALDLFDLAVNPALLDGNWGFYALSTVTAAIFGFLALWLLEYTIKHSRLLLFAWYLIAVSILSVLFV